MLLYGHLDKQPEMTGWRAGLGPWTPVIEDGKLYGRGGFAAFPWASCCDDQGTARLFAQPVTNDPVELVLNRTWRAALAVVGADGLPALESAGNVQRPFTALGSHCGSRRSSTGRRLRANSSASSKAMSRTRPASRSNTTPPRPAGTPR